MKKTNSSIDICAFDAYRIKTSNPQDYIILDGERERVCANDWLDSDKKFKKFYSSYGLGQVLYILLILFQT